MIYTIVVTNSGSDPAFNVVVRDTLPAGFVFQSAADAVPGPNAFLCSLNGTSTVTCSGATILGRYLPDDHDHDARDRRAGRLDEPRARGSRQRDP